MAFVGTQGKAIARTSALLPFAFWFVACGGGGSDPAPVERTSAQKQCDSLVSLWCENAIACVEEGLLPEDRLTDEELANERELCVDVAKSSCDATTGVSDDYDACRASVDPLEGSECDAIREAVREGEDVSMPSRCSAIFTAG